MGKARGTSYLSWTCSLGVLGQLLVVLSFLIGGVWNCSLKGKEYTFMYNPVPTADPNRIRISLLSPQLPSLFNNKLDVILDVDAQNLFTVKPADVGTPFSLGSNSQIDYYGYMDPANIASGNFSFFTLYNSTFNLVMNFTIDNYRTKNSSFQTDWLWFHSPKLNRVFVLYSLNGIGVISINISNPLIDYTLFSLSAADVFLNQYQITVFDQDQVVQFEDIDACSYIVYRYTNNSVILVDSSVALNGQFGDNRTLQWVGVEDFNITLSNYVTGNDTVISFTEAELVAFFRPIWFYPVIIAACALFIILVITIPILVVCKKRGGTLKKDFY